MNDKKAKDTIKQFVRENAMPLSVQAIGLIVLILNLWLASKLTPLAEGISLLNQRVLAIEVRNIRVEELIERFLKAEGNLENMDNRLERIENKLDKIDEIL